MRESSRKSRGRVSRRAAMNLHSSIPSGATRSRRNIRGLHDGFEQLVTDLDPNGPLAIQIVHFKDVITRNTGPAIGGKPAPAHKTGMGAESAGKSGGTSQNRWGNSWRVPRNSSMRLATVSPNGRVPRRRPGQGDRGLDVGGGHRGRQGHGEESPRPGNHPDGRRGVEGHRGRHWSTSR